MSRYRKVDPRIWNDAKFRTLNNHGKLLFFMLLTHPGMTALGAMRATPAGLAEELGWDAQAFRKAFADVLAKGMAEHHPEACLIALPNFIRYNMPESPNVIKAWVGALDLLPECDLKSAVVQRAKSIIAGMSEGFRQAFSEAFGQAMPNPEQEPEPKQKPKKNPPKPPRKRRGDGAAALVTLEQLVADGVEEKHGADWLAIRKTKRLPLTDTAWDQTKTEASKAGMTIDQAITYSVVRSRAGFMASWIAEDAAGFGAGGPPPAATVEWWENGAGISAKGVELNLGPWNETEQFPTYRARVFAAAGAGPWNAPPPAGLAGVLKTLEPV